jgi:hypothetical protein
MCGDHGSANPSAQACAASGRRPAADRWALTRARIWLSYVSVPVGDGGAGVEGGLGLGLGVVRGVDPRAGAVGRGGGGTEVARGVGVGALAGALAEALVGALVEDVDAGSVLVGAGAGDAAGVGASRTRATVGAAGSLQAVTPATRHTAPSSATANRPRGFDMTDETTPRGPRQASLTGRVHNTAPDVVGCT